MRGYTIEPSRKKGKRMEVKERAYAKINLFLDVVGKRSDGYHDIRSVMQTVSLCDEVEINVERADYSCITLKMENSNIPADERNLAYLAAERFLDESGVCAAVDITVKKYIPDCAGLGGGSADAAAVLRGLNLALGSPLSEGKLCAIAESLGADVPFCVKGGTRLCEGKGERMSIYPPFDAFFVIVPPVKEKIETPKAYGMLDEAFDNFEKDNAELHDALFDFFNEDAVLGMYNVFESVVIPLSPEIHEIRTALLDLGAAGALMTGSGSAVFGVFEGEREAEEAAKELPGAVVCKAVGALK